MSMPVNIVDGKLNTSNKVAVTQRGQLVTSPIAFSETHFNAMAVNGIAYNFLEPKANCQFVITDIIASGNKDVGANDGSNLVIYESDAADSLTEDNDLFVLTIGRNSTTVITGLNVITNKGKWINATMDDNIVNLTILGYFVEEDK